MKGSCRCGGVRFEAPDDAEGASACHCTQCRKASGHYWASAYAAEARIRIVGEVRWFEASPTARRGFCPKCGCFLFWKSHDEDTLSFSLGAIDGTTGLTLLKHIFTATKGDYYAITDGLPQRP